MSDDPVDTKWVSGTRPPDDSSLAEPLTVTVSVIVLLPDPTISTTVFKEVENDGAVAACFLVEVEAFVDDGEASEEPRTVICLELPQTLLESHIVSWTLSPTWTQSEDACPVEVSIKIAP